MTVHILPGSLLGWQPGFQAQLRAAVSSSPYLLEEEFIGGKPYFPRRAPRRPDRVQSRRYARAEGDHRLLARQHAQGQALLNLPAWAISAQDDVGAVNIVNFMHGGSDGHLTPPWPFLFENGLEKIADLCDEKREGLEMWTIEGIEKNRFYEASAMVLRR